MHQPSSQGLISATITNKRGGWRMYRRQNGNLKTSVWYSWLTSLCGNSFKLNTSTRCLEDHQIWLGQCLHRWMEGCLREAVAVWTCGYGGVDVLWLVRLVPECRLMSWSRSLWRWWENSLGGCQGWCIVLSSKVLNRFFPICGSMRHYLWNMGLGEKLSKNIRNERCQIFVISLRLMLFNLRASSSISSAYSSALLWSWWWNTIIWSHFGDQMF